MKKQNDFKVSLRDAELQDYVREASLSERGKMMAFHMMLLGAMLIMLFIIIQWFVGQHMAANLSAPLSGEHARARMMAVNMSSLTVSAITIFCLALMSKTPLTYMIFGARIVDARTLGEISRGQAALRCIIKTLATVITPLAIFYLIKNGKTNMVDAITQTRVVIIERRLVLEGDQESND